MKNLLALFLALFLMFVLSTNAGVLRGGEELAVLAEEEGLEDLLFWERQLGKSHTGKSHKKSKKSHKKSKKSHKKSKKSHKKSEKSHKKSKKSGKH